MLAVLGADGLPRGAQVRVRLGLLDDISLEVTGTVIERLDTPELSADALEAEAEEDAELAAPLTLALDMADDDSNGDAASSSAAAPASTATVQS